MDTYTYLRDSIRIHDAGVRDSVRKQILGTILHEPLVLPDILNCGSLHGISLNKEEDYVSVIALS